MCLKQARVGLAPPYGVLLTAFSYPACVPVPLISRHVTWRSSHRGLLRIPDGPLLGGVARPPTVLLELDRELRSSYASCLPGASV